MEHLDKKKVLQNVNNLVKIASKIEKVNPEVADEIDKISENYIRIMKEAQYVGVQGYALRNRRCFDNCLRQKRAKSDKPYDEIWGECHQEYLGALDNDGSDTWNKYASKEDKNVRNIPAELIKTADSLLDLSDRVKGQQSEELIRTANELIKEANWFTEMFNKMSPSLINIRKVLTQLGNQLQSASSTMQGSENSFNVAKKIQRELYKTIQTYVNDFTTSRDFRGLNTRAKKSIQEIAKQLGELRGKIGSAKKPDQLSQIINESQSTIQNLISHTKGIEDQAKTDIDLDGVPNEKDVDNNNDGIADSNQLGAKSQEAQSGGQSVEQDTPQEESVEQQLTQMLSQLNRTLKSFGEQYKERGLNNVLDAAKEAGLEGIIDSAVARKLMGLPPAPAGIDKAPVGMGAGTGAMGEGVLPNTATANSRRKRII